MWLPRNPADAAILSTVLFPFLSAAAGYPCDHVLVDGVGFNLQELGGPRSVLHSEAYGGKNRTTTFTVDICKSLGKVKGNEKQQCPHGTQVCAINRSINGAGDEEFDEWIAIAGELKEKGGGHMDSKVQRLKTSPSHADSEKEGLSWEMNGGFRELEGNEKRKQKAIIELVCDQKRTGLENLYDPKEKYEDAPDGKDGKNKREDSDKTDEDDEKSSSLKYVRWDQDGGDVDILRLEWRTKFACEGAKDDKDQEDAAKGNHWGFFTWFIIIAFLSTATYLIFGSWLNYNRYGARGWDLLPHGDTIRDVPYLFKDWMRRVLNTIQGGGSRGGYAAV